MSPEEETKQQEAAWSQEVEEYIASIAWDDGTPDFVRTLVAGNIRGFAAHIRKQMFE